jgi:hypothetical protein
VPIKYEVATLVAYYTWFFTLANQFPLIYQKVGFVMLAHMAFGILHLQVRRGTPPPVFDRFSANLFGVGGIVVALDPLSSRRSPAATGRWRLTLACLTMASF